MMESQVPNQPIVPPAPKTSNHLTIFAFALFILLSLSAVVFLYYQNQQLKKMLIEYQVQNTPKPTPIATINPVNDWNTYTSNVHNFLFKYPTNWIVRGVAGSQKEPELSDSFFVEGPYQNIQTLEGGAKYVIKVEVSTTKQDSESSEQIIKSKQISNNKYVKFDMTLYNLTDEKLDSVTFDQILSTFKFLDSKSSVPKPISDLIDSINQNFNIKLIPVSEKQFYSQSGMINKQSWKIDLLNTKAGGKEFATFLRTQLSPNDLESAGIGGGGIDAFENSQIKCFHDYISQGDNIHNFLSCSQK